MAESHKAQLDPLSTALVLVAPAVLLGVFLLPPLMLRWAETGADLVPELADRFSRTQGAREAFAADLHRMAWLFSAGLLASAGVAYAGAKARITERTAIVWLTAVAVLVRAAALGREIVGDEARSWTAFIQPGPLAALTYYPAPNNHVLFSLVSAVALRLTGSYTFILLGWMGVSALGTWGMWRLLRTLDRPMAERVVGALLMATWPILVVWGMQLRGYGAMVALVPFVLELWFRLRQSPSARDWLLFAALGAAACALHLFAIFLIAGLALHVVLLPPAERRAEFRIGATLALAALVVFLLTLHALVLPQMWAYFRARSGAETYHGLRLMNLFGFFASKGLLRFALVSAISLGIVGMTLQRRTDVLFVTLVPLALGIGVTLVAGTFAFNRFFLYAAPGLVVLAAIGVGLPVELVRRLPSPTPTLRIGATLVAISFGVSLFVGAWRILPALYVRSGVAGQLQAQVARMHPSEVLVAGRIHPLVRFYFPEADRVRTPERLAAAAPGHIVIQGHGDQVWAAAFPEVAARLAADYDVVWTPHPRPGSRPTDLRSAAILVPREPAARAPADDMR